MSEREEVFEDYVATRLTLREHPVSLLAPSLGPFVCAADIRDAPDGRWMTVAGLVITRQRPGTASGVIFITLEDHTGVANIVVWPKTFEKHRKEVMAGRLLRIRGRLQREGIVAHVISSRIEDLSVLLDSLGDSRRNGAGMDPARPGAGDVARPAAARGGEQGRTPAQEAAAVAPQRTSVRNAAGARHPREQAKKLFRSRDFH